MCKLLQSTHGKIATILKSTVRLLANDDSDDSKPKCHLHATQVKKRVEPEPETTNGNGNANANDSGNRKHVMFVTGRLMAFHETDQTHQVQLTGEPDEENQETWTVDQVDWGVLLCQTLDNVCGQMVRRGTLPRNRSRCCDCGRQ
jgi:hypothetical protein